jgi:hypothetical protein
MNTEPNFDGIGRFEPRYLAFQSHFGKLAIRLDFEA